MEKNEHTDQQEFVEIDLDKFFFTDHVFRELLEERYGKFNYCVFKSKSSFRK